MPFLAHSFLGIFLDCIFKIVKTFLRKLVLAEVFCWKYKKLVALNLAAVFSVSPDCVPATEEIQTGFVHLVRRRMSSPAGKGSSTVWELRLFSFSCSVIIKKKMYSVHNLQIKQTIYFNCYLLFRDLIQHSVCIIKAILWCIYQRSASQEDLTEYLCMIGSCSTRALVLCQHSMYLSKLIFIKWKQTT